jgi:hypothetical protein
MAAHYVGTGALSKELASWACLLHIPSCMLSICALSKSWKAEPTLLTFLCADPFNAMQWRAPSAAELLMQEMDNLQKHGGVLMGPFTALLFVGLDWCNVCTHKNKSNLMLATASKLVHSMIHMPLLPTNLLLDVIWCSNVATGTSSAKWANCC